MGGGRGDDHAVSAGFSGLFECATGAGDHSCCGIVVLDMKSSDPEARGGLEDFAAGGLKAMSADGGADTVGDDGGARDIGLREEDREHFFGVAGGVVDGAQVPSE